MTRRVAVAAVAIPAALGLVYLGGWVLAGLIAVFGIAGAREIYRLAERGGVRPTPIAGYVGAAGLPLVGYAVLPDGLALETRWAVLGGTAWLIALVATTTATRPPTARPLAAAAVTGFGAVYAGGLPAFLLLLRHSALVPSPWAATAIVFLPLVLTWVCDSLAMAGGFAIGGPKLAPVLSPNKTWAGAVSGSLGAVVLAPLYGAIVLAPLGVGISTWLLLVFGGVVSMAGQVGDVAESLLKREVGVKDSGSFFPGHGGVLDRFDSLYWVIPTSALLLTLFGTV
ncbi:MAG: phosphatidate cytidylyltransferase [Gemmatimonadales bacterium]|nr:phosphatidate cytidylyltransferase [Gemmatimonadales bacterium]NIN11679.1 phosphatidate cytidylyltransferase [Gemmatimonadales bacterium]NIN50285.1 phosphatidate cytidylyltransferase [Gemmatimonadales bacterium]NIP07749.1 phosphatidate cytidylyltransferase [Gemmatimonadales bacterium]NIQ99152.1 phosphatidate cytidylyltransferase [Gemmatimonadales bacterium]